MSARAGARHALTAHGFPVLAQSAQAPHQHRIVLEGLCGVDKPAEELVVTRRRHIEISADRFVFRAAVDVPPGLEGEEGAIAIGKGHTLTLNPGTPLVGEPLHTSAERVDRGEDPPVETEREAARPRLGDRLPFIVEPDLVDRYPATRRS